MIYDNGASTKNKGFNFSMNRVRKKLYSWYLKNGLTGFIVLIDFSKFFENCSHDVIHDIHKKYIINDSAIKVIGIGKGIALGVEIAQKEAIMVPNLLDHYIQNRTVLNRYMDDSIFFVKTYEEGKILLEEYKRIANELKIKINEKKSYIIPINQSFVYCKWNYKLLKTGKIICKPCIKTIKRQKQKLRKMISLNMPFEEIECTKNSFNAYLSLGNTSIYHK